MFMFMKEETITCPIPKYQIPISMYQVPITNYRLPVERDADNGEGGDEAEEDGEDSGHCAKETAYET